MEGGGGQKEGFYHTHRAVNIDSWMYCLSSNAVNHCQILFETLIELVDNSDLLFIKFQ